MRRAVFFVLIVSLLWSGWAQAAHGHLAAPVAAGIEHADGHGHGHRHGHEESSKEDVCDFCTALLTACVECQGEPHGPVLKVLFPANPPLSVTLLDPLILRHDRPPR